MAATPAIPGTGFRFVHAGAAEIRRFIPEVDDTLFATMAIPPYGADDFMADLDRMTQGRMNRELAQTLVEQSNAAVHWMREIGIKWEPLKEHAKVDGKRYFERGIAIHVAGGGLGQLTQWRQIAERLGIEIRFEVAGLRRARRSAPGRRRRASAVLTAATISWPRR